MTGTRIANKQHGGMRLRRVPLFLLLAVQVHMQAAAQVYSDRAEELHPEEFMGGAWNDSASGGPRVNTVVRTAKNLTDSTEEDAMHLINLNSFVQAYYLGCENPARDPKITTACGPVLRSSLDAAFVITKLPDVGQFFQATRHYEDKCTYKYPESCKPSNGCCGYKIFTSYNPDGSEDKTCCAYRSNHGPRVFLRGEGIVSTPSKVTIPETGFVLYQPPADLFTGSRADATEVVVSFGFSVEYWKKSFGPKSPATATDSGCAADREKCANNSIVYEEFCRYCSEKQSYNITLTVKKRRKYPAVGFGGHMIAFDGGDDFVRTHITRMPQYEFGIQLWFQQNKIREGQTLLTWWSDRGREWEIADTSNIYYIHFNNQTQRTGVGVNDGKWHHLAFSWLLVCKPEFRKAGMTYCVQGQPLDPFAYPAIECDVDQHCSHVEISLFVDGVKRAESRLPAFLLSLDGQLVLGQSMQRPFKTAEIKLRDEHYQRLRQTEENIASNLPGGAFSDNQLELIFSRLRSSYYNNSQLFESTLSKQTREGYFRESEPWRDPLSKYCDLTAPGGFRPGAGLSANIDEFRMYNYYRTEWDIALGMNFVINADGHFTFTPHEGNWSLILYYNFDMNDDEFAVTSKDDIRDWPLVINDESPFDGTGLYVFRAELGGGKFQWAPLRVPSTAPIRGSRTLQIAVQDFTEPISLNVLDLQFDPDTPRSGIYTRVEQETRFGKLYAAADDCDSVRTVSDSIQAPAVSFRPEGCRGSIIGFFFHETTVNCTVGGKIRAADQYGSGMVANITDISDVGAIAEISMITMGKGYDWTRSSRLNRTSDPIKLYTDQANCVCANKPSNVEGNLNPCFRPIISAGKADKSGADFAGFDMDPGRGTTDGFPVFYEPTCSPQDNGGFLCPAVKPRPCVFACHREYGWMTDIKNEPTLNQKYMVGPFSMYAEKGYKDVFWSNSMHTIWYRPEHFRERNYYIKVGDSMVLQDTIKDEFIVRFYDYMPPLGDVSRDPENPPPFLHLWIQIVYEKLAIPLNTSIIWEESSPVLVQLHLVDLHRGTSVLNSPFSVHVDLPASGKVYQAVRIEKKDNEEEFSRECVCPTKPRFPKMDRTLEKTKYGEDLDLPGIRQCNVSKIGFFCYKKGSEITLNDTVVESTMDTMVVPGFQHSRDGMFVIYDMGIEQSGTALLKWRLKYPQGQILNGTVDIQIRSVNNRPVALDASLTTEEDTFAEVKLTAIDIDDVRKPAMYITQFPSHGTLYQCNATSRSSPCRLGERFSRVNETEPQWAVVQVDPAGAIDDEVTTVMRILDLNSDDISNQPIKRTNAGTSTFLAHGYGFGSYHFDPDVPDNFKKLCHKRGTVAADLLLKDSVFVSDIDFFYPIRFDTPFRILAQRSRQFEYISYDYSSRAGELGELEVTSTKVTKQGYNFLTQKGGIHFEDSGKWRAEQSFSNKRVDCGQATDEYRRQTVCQQIWNGSAYVRGEERSTITEETERWFELFRGLPHQAHAEYDRISPVLASTFFQTKRVRIEACGANMRALGEMAPNFLENVHRVRVWGAKTQRSKGTVRDLNRRVVYVPDYNFNGHDSFEFRVVDHAGGAMRSSSQFSLQRHWSPVVKVNITVKAKGDKPLATSVVASQVLGTTASEVVITTPGFYAGSSDGAFDIEITLPPVRGSVVLGNGSPAAGGLKSYDGILKYRALNIDECGGGLGNPFDSFEYRIKKKDAADGHFSRAFKVMLEIRCKTGYTCDMASYKCSACPMGTYGDDSGIENKCHLCPAGSFQGRTAAKTCAPCPPGSYNPTPGAAKCQLCPEGTYSGLEGMNECTECPGGSFGPFEGLLECFKCGSKHWTTTIGSFTCKDCPNNTRARQDRSVGMHSCECEHGFYNVHGRFGVDCLPCPPGAYCHGRSLLPVARTGYWTSQEIWTKDFEDMETGVVTLGHAHFAPCTFRYLRGVCIGYPEVDVQEQEERCLYRDHYVNQGPEFLDDWVSASLNVNISRCTLRDLSVPGEAAPEGLRPWILRQAYTANSFCATGYTGVICSQCADGFYRGLTAYCFECSALYTVPVISFLFFSLVLVLNCFIWIVLFYAACHPARSMYIAISHIQLIAMLGRIGVPWPDFVQGPIWFSSLTNLALDGIHWECIGLRSGFEARWVIEMFLPASIVFSIYFHHYFRVFQALALVRTAEAQEQDAVGDQHPVKFPSSNSSVRAKTSTEATNVKESASLALEQASVSSKSDEDLKSDQENESSGSDSEGDDNVEENKRQEELAAQQMNDRDYILVMTPKEIRKLRDKGIWLTSMALNFLFVMATSTLLIPFNCSEVSDTLHYLDWYPNFSCGTQTHRNLIFFSYIAGILWICLFPAAMIYILRKGWYNELITDRLFVRQFGWLCECYETKYFWWECMVLFRKAVVVGIANTLTDNAYLQLLILLAFLSIFLFWTAYCAPYVQERHNVLDIWLQAQLMMILLFALTNVIGNDGMKIVTTLMGKINENERIKILEPEPDMDLISDKAINSNVVPNFTFMAVTVLTASGAIFMVLYDLYESRVKAPEWAPYLWNAIFGCGLWEWDEFVSNLLAKFDSAFTRVRDRNKVQPPTRPASRWAHRIAMMEGVARQEEFSMQESVEAMLAAAVAATHDEEWARDKESCTAYIRSLDKRIFASEMYNSKASNLPILERQRNLAKKRLMHFLHGEVGHVFKTLYDQTGLNEAALWDIQELEQLRQEKVIIEAGEAEHTKHLGRETSEQQRRVGDVKDWKLKYEEQKRECEGLRKQIKQARDALLLYHLEESDDSEEEDNLDQYLEQKITKYIENKSVQDLVQEGLLEPQPIFQ